MGQFILNRWLLWVTSPWRQLQKPDVWVIWGQCFHAMPDTAGAVISTFVCHWT
jgi:hypothetical protein